MHKSKLAGFIIDCNQADVRVAGSFWSSALGMELEKLPGKEGQKYARLRDPAIDLHIEVQTVSHPSRVHLDIETDDIAAEVHRLEALGAKKIEEVESWTVMEAPTGQRFCVVRPTTTGFSDTAHEWQ